MAWSIFIDRLPYHLSSSWGFLGPSLTLKYKVLSSCTSCTDVNCFLVAYGANAIVAKTDEEIADRESSLYGDYDNADDIKINMPGSKPSNGEIEMQNGAGNRDSIDSRVDGRDSVDGQTNGHQNRQSMDSLDQAEAGGVSRQQSMQQEQAIGLTGTQQGHTPYTGTKQGHTTYIL